MRATLKAMWAAAGFALVSGQVLAQPPERGGGGAPGGGALNPAQLIEKLKVLDANKDGKISKDEVKDERLQRLFDRMDADKNGEVTKEEMEKLIGQMGALEGGGRGRGERNGEGRGGRGGPPGGGGPEGGRGGPGGAWGWWRLWRWWIYDDDAAAWPTIARTTGGAIEVDR
jgi:hypothetical protein